MKPKVIIIGGGVAGLSAGIYAQKCGFQSQIHEQHTIAGGECTVWRRKGFLLDNCVHWLTGTNPKTETFKVWQQVGVLGDGVEIIQHESFLQVELGGKTLNVWQDIEKMREEMLALAPEDTKPIEEFIRTVRAYCSVVMPSLKPEERLTPIDFLRLIWQMRNLGPIHQKLQKVSIADYAKRFKNPLLRKFITVYMPKTYNVASLFYVFGTFCSGNGALPRGGSQGIVERMETLYKSLDGEIVTSSKATKIAVENRRATVVEFADGKTLSADFIICACDTDVTFRLLGEEFMDKFFKTRYQNPEKYPLYSSFNCYFAVEKTTETLPITTALECENLKIGTENFDNIIVKHFNYEPSFAPEGKSVLQTISVQYEKDYDFWKNLRETDHEAYKAEKLRIGEEIRARLEKRFPELAGKISLLDASTPYTYTRYCEAYKGAYMSFILSTKNKISNHHGRLKMVKNLYLASQWLQPPGGLPNAVVTGRFALQRLCRDFGFEFKE